MEKIEKSRRSATRVFALGLLCAGVASACGQHVTFSVLSPAKVNVRKLAGNEPATISIGSWQSQPGQAAQAREIAQFLRELVLNAEGGVVQLKDANGVVRLDGELTQHSYHEEIKSFQGTCTRRENNKQVKYSCTTNTRHGKAEVRASMNVVGRDGTTLAAVTEACVKPETTRATDAKAPEIDPEPLLLSCRQQIAAQFAKAVVPYRIDVTKPWFKCGDAEAQCSGALAQLRAGNFDQAQELLEQAQKVVASDSESLAAVHWGLALTAEFSGRYAEAEKEIQSCMQLWPSEAVFAEELSAIRKLEAAESELRAQGVK